VSHCPGGLGFLASGSVPDTVFLQLTGDNGDEGMAGYPGHQGPPGLPGPAGSRGLVGKTGDKGLKGTQGESGELGPNGREGDNGPPGQIGIQGITGIPGPIGPIAFAVGLTISYPPPNTPIVYKHIYYNIQGNYNSVLGIYTAPSAGTYVFSYHVSTNLRILKCGLFLNYVPVVKTTDKKLRGTASQSVLLHLVAGDRVWMQVKDLETNGMYVSAENNNIFSGYLLHPDTCEVPIVRSLNGTPTPRPSGGSDHYEWGIIPGNATVTPNPVSG
uniref:Collagen alpha-1(X) chain-like n=1 Tax=Cynoglossus semilaevis TaxID=244447 RepID=A0A3P8VMU3_CYNSE